MPLFKLGHLTPQQARERTEELLDFVGLRDLAQSPTHDLSAPQQWSASVARALANYPSLLLVEYPEKQLPPDFLPAAARLLEQASQKWDLAAVVTTSESLPGAMPLHFPAPESTFPSAL
jgi:ABC-type methionine transport system ATPase subunit